MKKIFIAFLLVSLNYCISNAQKPQEILGIAKEKKSIEYYEEQAGLWKKETEKDAKNAYAHWQYYRAQRAFLQLSYPEIWATDHSEIFSRLRPIINRAKKSIDKSFEYYLMESDNMEPSMAIGFLKKAFQVDPSRKETLGGLLIHYSLTFQNNKAKEIAEKIIEVNLYSNANLTWNYNTLETVAKNGVYIASGDMDVLPKWVLQSGKDIRTDILVVSKWMMINDKKYRKNVFEKIGISDFKKTINDFDTPLEYAGETVAYIMKNSPRPAYVGNGTHVKFFRKMGMEENVYLTGLAFVFSKKDFDNLEVIRENFEEKYQLDYLINNFQIHPEDGMVKGHMNLTYLPGLVKMRDFFKKKNNKTKENYYQSLIENIAKESGREKEIMSWFKHK